MKKLSEYQSERDNIPENPQGVIGGRNAVTELLRSGKKPDKIFVAAGMRNKGLAPVIALAGKNRVPVADADKKKLDALCPGVVHQGVVAIVGEVDYVSVDDILENAKSKGEKPFIIIADSVNDPQNLGAIVRSACCAGAHGVIIPKRRSATMTASAVKASAGAAEYMPICRVSNLADTVDRLKKEGVWIYALEADGEAYYGQDLSGAAAFILGGEDTGVSRILREKSDFVLSIPMFGQINSLNVSCAGAIVMFEAAKQRH